MGIEYHQHHVLVAEYSVLHSQVAVPIVAELGALPQGIILDIDAEKLTPFDAGDIRLNTTATTSQNIGSTAEIAATAEGTARVENWRSSIGGTAPLQELVRSGQQLLFAYLTGSTPSSGEIRVYVRYLPADFGY